jgi:ABC-type uncharacterized transport system permease subunit
MSNKCFTSLERENAQMRAVIEQQKEVIETRNGDVETEQMWVKHWYDKYQEQSARWQRKSNDKD